MIKRIVGGIIAVAIGGTVYSVSQSDIAKNFSNNTGLTQEQAQQYINNIPEDQLASFSKIGQGFIDDGNSVTSELPSIDCINYSYTWEKRTLSCPDGKNQMRTLGNDEVSLGRCYQALDTNLGDSAKAKISECIYDIDKVNSDYGYPVVTALIDAKTISENKNTNSYNKSLLQAALESK